MVEAARCHRFPHREQVGKLHHLIASAAHVNIGDVVGIGSIHVGHLDDDIVLFAIELKARNLAPAEHGFKCAADRLDIRADIGNLVAVDTDFEFRFVQAKVGVDVGEAGIFCRLRDQAIHILLQFLVGCGSHYDELQRLVAALTERGRADGKRIHTSEAAKLRCQFAGDFLLTAGSVFPVLETQNYPPVGDCRKADDRVVTYHFRNLLVDIFDLLHVTRCVADRRTLGR